MQHAEGARPDVPALPKACGLLQHTAAYEALLRGCMMHCGAAGESRGSTISAPSLPAVTACGQRTLLSPALIAVSRQLVMPECVESSNAGGCLA